VNASPATQQTDYRTPLAPLPLAKSLPLPKHKRTPVLLIVIISLVIAGLCGAGLGLFFKIREKKAAEAMEKVHEEARQSALQQIRLAEEAEAALAELTRTLPKLTVSIENEAMSALLRIEPGGGENESVTIEDLQKTLHENNVFFGINEFLLEKAVKKCVECHSQNSLLLASLYKYQVQEKRSKQGYLNAAIMTETYVIGANRNYFLNIASMGIFGLVVIGIAIHAVLRKVHSKK